MTSRHFGSFLDWSLRLDPGDLALVRLPDPRLSGLLADAACGLTEITAGTLSFLGRDWRRPAADEAARLRSRIGRVFGEVNWIGYLPVDESVLLKHLHHRAGRREDLLRQAAELCREFRLPGVPIDRPNALSRADLMRASCARAFLGQPRLVLLEQPMRDLPTDMLNPIIMACDGLRRLGGAVLWFSNDTRVWNSGGIDATHRLAEIGGRMTPTDQA